jgi:ATP-dependent Clp protease ATP-binding subunit ClpA
MTSNAGSEQKESALGFNRDANEYSKDKSMKALKDFLRPEFIGRVDEVIFFKNLDKESLIKISDILIDELKEPLKDKAINFVVGEGVSKIIAEKSVDGGRGARDIRRNIRKEIEDKIADILIDRADKETSEINVTAVDNEIKVSYKK